MGHTPHPTPPSTCKNLWVQSLVWWPVARFQYTEPGQRTQKITPKWGSPLSAHHSGVGAGSFFLPPPKHPAPMLDFHHPPSQDALCLPHPALQN